jgi:CHAT domain-containing protein
MCKRLAVLLSYGLLYSITLSGQCLGREELWNKLVQLRDSANITQQIQLRLLLAEESKLKSCPAQIDSAYTFLLRRIATTYYKVNEYENAEKYYRKYVNVIVLNINNPAINQQHVIPGYFGLALVYDSLNRVSDKMNAYDSCYSVGNRYHAVDIYCLAALYKRVEFYFDIGDYNHCIDYAIACETYAKKYSAIGKNEYSVGLNYISSSLVWEVNAMLILKRYEEVEKILGNQISTKGKLNAGINSSLIYSQLSQLDEYRGNYENALSHLKLAYLFERGRNNRIGCMEILNNIGYNIYFKHYRDFNNAHNYYRKALAYANQPGEGGKLDSIEVLNIYANIAGIYLNKGLFDSAFHYFKLAFNQVKSGAEETSILNSSLDEFAREKKIGYLTNLFIDKGDAYFSFYKYSKNSKAAEECIRIYKLTDKLLDKIKAEQFDLQSKLFWRSDSRRLYEHAIEACYVYGDIPDVFYFFEKSRAVLLNDQLKEQRWLNDPDIQKQNQVKRNIIRLERSLKEVKNSASDKVSLQEKLFYEKADLDHIVQGIRSRYPLYFQNYLDTSVITINQVQEEILGDHQAMVEIFEGDSAVYTLILTQKESKLNRIEKNLFDSLSKSYLYYISSLSASNVNFNSFVKTSRDLYQLLFKNTPIPKGRIVISPDGQYFPFESLVTSKEGQPIQYYLNDYAISYTYSARYLVNNFSSNNSGKSFLGVAPVNYPTTMQLASLNGSDQSLSRIRAQFPNGNSLLMNGATKSRFLDEFYKYKVIQLYTHASSANMNGEPVIYFADSLLYLSDILSENKPATQLIILAACETGNGKDYKGEGIFSFNRAFASIGIPSSITNLWTVENESMYQLTELFYGHLLKGNQADIALQLAKLEFIKTVGKQKKLPYYWAASVLVGNSGYIVVSHQLNWKIIWGAVATLLFLSILLFVYQRYFAQKIHSQNQESI